MANEVHKKNNIYHNIQERRKKMEQNYKKVPDILTGKDLDYLSDMFAWNYNALKFTDEAYEHTDDEELKKVLEKAYKLFKGNIEEVLSILEGGSNE